MQLSFKIPQTVKNLWLKLDLQSKLTLFIVLIFAFGLLLLLTVFNQAGRFGNLVNTFLSLFFGILSFFIPFAFFWGGVMLMRIQKNHELVKEVNSRLIWGLILMFLSVASFLNWIFQIQSIDEISGGGGLVGFLIYPFLLNFFGYIGALVIIISIGLFGFFLVSQMTPMQFWENLIQTIKNPKEFWDFIPDVFENWKVFNKPQKVEIIDNLDEEKENIDILESQILEQKTQEQINNEQKNNLDNNLKISSEKNFVLIDDDEIDKKNLNIEKSIESDNTNVIPLPQINWNLPKDNILKNLSSRSFAGDVERNKKKIKDTLEHFGITVEMADVVTGPTVSQYTLKPAKGVKLSSIDGVQRDMALALAASSLRLEAPIPGKSLVGIEIPNEIKSQVRIGSIIHTEEFHNHKNPLPVAVGEDVAGKKVIYSLTKMPHLLVAGSTGSGKSVWINSMLVSLLFKYTPKNLQLILVDMKRVELKLYEGVPHLLCPVITEATKAINALKWTVAEMDNRYKILEKYGKRNIADYNDFVGESKLAKEMGLAKIPYLVLVIDELGDLMILAKNEVEPIIVRLTQMSRAVGIHLVLGTQRPDTHVVTGLIKANIPSRIAFAVASQIDSRVILDQVGAEKLLGQGDGLFMSPSTIKPIRFQGCLVEELEVRKCVSFWRQEAKNNQTIGNLKEEVVEPLKTKIVVPGMVDSSEEENGDDLYQKCKSFVIRQQGASTSMLQTAFGIGYPKARKIIESLEAEGVVGPANGSKPREVYVEFND